MEQYVWWSGNADLDASISLFKQHVVTIFIGAKPELNFQLW